MKRFVSFVHENQTYFPLLNFQRKDLNSPGIRYRSDGSLGEYNVVAF